MLRVGLVDQAHRLGLGRDERLARLLRFFILCVSIVANPVLHELAVREAVKLVEDVAEAGVRTLDVQPKLAHPALELRRALLEPLLECAHAGLELRVL